MVFDPQSGQVVVSFGALLVFVACSSKQPVDPVTTPAGAKPCEAMAAHLVDLLGGGPEETLTRMRTAFNDRCVGDKWTMDAVSCFSAVPSIDEAKPCAQKLTIDQRDGFSAAIDEATK